MRYDESRVKYLFTQPRTEPVVEELIALNYGLLNKQLRKFYLLNDPDALSYGYEALYKAIMTFDGRNKFSTYATVCIYNRLGSYVRSLNNLINSNTVSCDAGDEGTILATLESTDKADTAILSSVGVKTVYKLAWECYHELKNPVHQDIVGEWIESEFTMTQVNIAAELKVSQAYVQQVLKTFKSNLKKKLGAIR